MLASHKKFVSQLKRKNAKLMTQTFITLLEELIIMVRLPCFTF